MCNKVNKINISSYFHYFMTNAELIESIVAQENWIVPCGRITSPEELRLNSDFYKLLDLTNAMFCNI